jgi:uncharacterized protein YdaU (DUF1376 family)
MTRKSPAFSFYPDSWIGGTALMSSEEKAIYIDLLCVAWLHRKFTLDQALNFCRGSSRESVERVVLDKFREENDGFFVNPRLEEERSKQQSRIENGKKGGRPKKANQKLNGKLNESQSKDSVSVSVSVSDSLPESVDKPPTEVLHGAAEADSMPTHSIEFPIKPKGRPWLLAMQKFDEWSDTYDDREWVESQLRLARQWLADNPQKRKTASGMARFLGSWLSRANNRGDGMRGKQQEKTTSRVATDDDLASWNPNGGDK